MLGVCRQTQARRVVSDRCAVSAYYRLDSLIPSSRRVLVTERSWVASSVRPQGSRKATFPSGLGLLLLTSLGC